METTNKKSDAKAKVAYKMHIENSGYNDVKVVASRADFIAQKNGEVYYFEIKMTKRNDVYFLSSNTD